MPLGIALAVRAFCGVGREKFAAQLSLLTKIETTRAAAGDLHSRSCEEKRSRAT